MSESMIDSMTADEIAARSNELEKARGALVARLSELKLAREALEADDGAVLAAIAGTDLDEFIANRTADRRALARERADVKEKIAAIDGALVVNGRCRSRLYAPDERTMRELEALAKRVNGKPRKAAQRPWDGG
jgi:hypothetical protein